jgi:hypothetical protein
MVAKPAALLAQGTLSRHPGDLRMIVLFRKVRQDEELGSSIIVVRQEICESIIGEMADAAHHPLLDAPRIRAAAQQFEIVIGFDHQHVASAQVVANAVGHVSEIGADADLDAVTAKREADGIDSVVRNGERLHCDVADLEGAAGGERLPTRDRDAVAGAVTRKLLIRVIRWAGDVNRDLEPLGQYVQSTDVVGVLVRDEDGVDAVWIKAAQNHAPQKLAAGETCVHQQVGAGTGDNGAVPLASARQHGDRYCHAREHNRKRAFAVVTNWLTHVEKSGIDFVGVRLLSRFSSRFAQQLRVLHTICTAAIIFVLVCDARLRHSIPSRDAGCCVLLPRLQMNRFGNAR